MDIKEYSYVLAIVDNGNISKAAQALYISQPSLSIFLKNLENRLGTKLFDRRDGKLELTYEGERYVKYARRIVTLNDDLEQELEDIQKNNLGRIRIGVMLTRATYTLPALLKGLKERHPQIEIHVVEEPQGTLEQMVASGEIDIAFINYPFKESGLEYIELAENNAVLVASKEMGLAEKAERRESFPYPYLDLKQLDPATPYVLLKSGRSLRMYADKVFGENGVTPRVLFETALITTALSAARAGLGAAFVYDSLVLEEGVNDLDIFSVGEDLGRRYVLVYSGERKLSNLVKLVIESSAEILSGTSWKNDD
ncbi:MAG: LysR family transcriptional regulator [Firmicutes bacterium]|nr:LysR family transcriptional regulator [Bacillota bacterium]